VVGITSRNNILEPCLCPKHYFFVKQSISWSKAENILWLFGFTPKMVQCSHENKATHRIGMYQGIYISDNIIK
jgi:hypothetical protein